MPDINAGQSAPDISRAGCALEIDEAWCHRRWPMAKHDELSKRIWRTVVFAGAMLAAPVGCGGGDKKQAAEPAPVQPAATQSTDDQAAADAAAKEAADKKAADEAAMKMEADKKAADEAAAKEEADKKAAEELAAKEAADKKAADEAAAKKKRPRTTTKTRPTGRGFILS
jgi:hypothetical protein